MKATLKHIVAGLFVAVGTLLYAASALAGAPDPSFGVDGRVKFDAYSKGGVGSILAGDSSTYVGSNLGDLARLDSGGALDQAYGNAYPGGYASVNPYLGSIRGGHPNGAAMVAQPDGKVLVAGAYGRRPMLSRMTTVGKLDRSFADRGAVLNRTTNYLGAARNLTDLALDAHGRILVVGERWGRKENEPTVRGLVARYLPSGKLDRSFGKRGRLLFRGLGKVGVKFGSVEVRPNGRILILRTTTKSSSILALRPSGRLDRRFAGGKGYLKLSGPPLGFPSLDTTPEGEIMAFGVSNKGSTDGCARLFSFHTSGRLRSSFAGDGKKIICSDRFSEIWPWFEETPIDVDEAGFALQGDGKAVISLSMPTGRYGGPQATVRFEQSGAIDLSFADNGLFLTRDIYNKIPIEGLGHGFLIAAGHRYEDPHHSTEDFVYRFGS